MEFWQVVSWCETGDLVEVARIAEETGFDGLILAEHVFYPHRVRSVYPYAPDGRSPMSDELEFPDPLIAFAAAAAVTRRLRFMTGVYLLGLRHPVEAARNTATLAVLSGGRFALGVGSGWLAEEYAQLGVDFASRGARLDESIAVLRQLWSGERVSHAGRFFRFEELRVRPAPDRPPPVIGGGLSGPALRRAATLCDGWYGPGNVLADLPPLIARLQALRAAAGLPWDGFRVTAPLLTPLDVASCRALAAMGVHATVNYPFLFGCGAGAPVTVKRRYMEEFAERVIVPARAALQA
jgi:probable F420-dependent oxidoreductase